MKCRNCHKQPRSEIYFLQCGHSFCHVCATAAIKESSRCPVKSCKKEHGGIRRQSSTTKGGRLEKLRLGGKKSIKSSNQSSKSSKQRKYSYDSESDSASDSASYSSSDEDSGSDSEEENAVSRKGCKRNKCRDILPMKGGLSKKQIMKMLEYF